MPQVICQPDDVLEVGVVDADKHAAARAHERRLGGCGVVHRRIPVLEEKPVLRVRHGSLGGGDTEEAGVKELGAV